MKPTSIAPDYTAFLTEVKGRIQTARLQAGRAVNRELVMLYWDIGRGIVDKQQVAGWGEAVVERLAADLRAEFPDMRGFSTRNIWDMRRFFEAYGTDEFLRQAAAETSPGSTKPHRLPGGSRELSIVASDPAPFLRQLVAEIPWGHHLVILNKLADPAARLYYAQPNGQARDGKGKSHKLRAWRLKEHGRQAECRKGEFLEQMESPWSDETVCMAP